ncbi:unnamed protein product, partial [Musa textilis]
EEGQQVLLPLLRLHSGRKAACSLAACNGDRWPAAYCLLARSGQRHPRGQQRLRALPYSPRAEAPAATTLLAGQRCLRGPYR